MTFDALKIHLGKRVHLVGIGGIGMSGLAQLLAQAGVSVSGSDRALHQPENKRIFDALRAQGIMLFEQDGSFAKAGAVDALIYSTAVESDNPDFLAAPNVKLLHRAAALQLALLHYNANKRIAICGSAGKTTTSAWLGETFNAMGLAPTILCGGALNRFVASDCVGNFVKGEGDYFVFEADESDKSVTQYSPEFTALLNMGTDHYSKEELADVFSQVLRQTQTAAVLDDAIYKQLPEDCRKHLFVRTFSLENANSDYTLVKESIGGNIFVHEVKTPYGNKVIELPLSGRHNIANALAILAMSECCGGEIEKAIESLKSFKGVWRRFDFAGVMRSGAKVYDDYAHNIEKISSVIATARLQLPKNKKLIILFQPHGFGPLKFMRNEMNNVLPEWLKSNDLYLLLPVYYAGGTSSFTPTSDEVVQELISNHPDYSIFAVENREKAVKTIAEQAEAEDIVLVLGARDNSLSDWAKEIANKH